MKGIESIGNLTGDLAKLGLYLSIHTSLGIHSSTMRPLHGFSPNHLLVIGAKESFNIYHDETRARYRLVVYLLSDFSIIDTRDYKNTPPEIALIDIIKIILPLNIPIN